MTQETVVKRLRGLVDAEIELLGRYSLRNLGVSHEVARTACEVVKSSIKQLKAYGIDTSTLYKQYRDMRSECRGSWGEHVGI